MKLVDSCDSLEAIHILQLVVVQFKIVNTCDTFEAVDIPQLVVVKPKIIDSFDTFKAVNIFQSFSAEVDVFCKAVDKFISRVLNFLLKFRIIWLLFCLW